MGIQKRSWQIVKGDYVRIKNGWGQIQVSQVEEVLEDGRLWLEGSPESGSYILEDVELQTNRFHALGWILNLLRGGGPVR